MDKTAAADAILTMFRGAEACEKIAPFGKAYFLSHRHSGVRAERVEQLVMESRPELGKCYTCAAFVAAQSKEQASELYRRYVSVLSGKTIHIHENIVEFSLSYFEKISDDPIRCHVYVETR